MGAAAFLLLLTAHSLLASPLGEAPKQAAAAVETSVRPGTTIPAKVTQGVDLKKVRVGDTVMLEVMIDVKDPLTRAVSIPRNAMLLATVSYLVRPADKKSPYVVRLEATRAQWPGGFATLKGSVVSAFLWFPEITSAVSGPPKSGLDRAAERNKSFHDVNSLGRPPDPHHTGPKMQLSVEGRMRDEAREDISKPTPTATPLGVAVNPAGTMTLPLGQRELAADSEVTFKHRPPGEHDALEPYVDQAVKGNAEAQFRIAYMYHHGEGVPQDYARSSDWYRRAAEQGHAEAQLSMAVLYAMGQGVPQDDVSSYMWFSVASRVLPERGAAGKRLLEKRMTIQQIEEGKQRAVEWTKDHLAAR